MGTVTLLVSPLRACIDGVLCCVRNLCSYPYILNNPVEDKIPVSGDDEMSIMISDSEHGDDRSVNSDLGGLSDGTNIEGHQLTMRLSQSTNVSLTKQ